MKRFQLLSLALIAACAASAQSKFDMPAGNVVDATRVLRSAMMSRADRVEPVRIPLDITVDQVYSVMVTVDGDAATRLADYDVVSAIDDMAIVRLTAEQMEALADEADIRSIALGTPMEAQLNTARATTGVDAIHAGTDLGGMKFDGTGVIAGLMDQGLDPNHINFLDADGNPRATAVWTVKSANAVVTPYLKPNEITSFSTDNSKESHGTHVLGIIAGSYNGPATYAFVNARGSVQIKKQAANNSVLPYYGVAPGAELAIACGDFSNNNVTTGAELVADYAVAQGKPGVVNISIGSSLGPHDGTDATSRWFERIGEKAIICISASNNGGSPMSFSKTFNAAGEALRTFPGSSASASGTFDFWAADGDEFDFTFQAYNRTTGEVLYSYKLNQASATISGNYYTASSYIHNAAFDTAFGAQGYVSMRRNVNSDNGRFQVYVNLSLAGTGTNVVPVFVIESKKANQHVDGFAFSGTFQSLGVDGYTQGSDQNSINGMACGKNVIVVGSYTNISYWPVQSGKAYHHYTIEPVVGQISDFSSYGYTFQGRQLPDIVGPGGSLISSYSKYYYDNQKLTTDDVTATYEAKTRNSYWGEMQGTSMSSPFVAGVVALWLQADPTLTVDDVKEVMRQTAIRDEAVLSDPARWGYGKIDALAGIKHILDMSGIADVTADLSQVAITSTDGSNYEVCVPGASSVAVKVYAVSGAQVASVNAAGDTALVSLDAAPAGVYVINVAAGNTVETRKILKK